MTKITSFVLNLLFNIFKKLDFTRYMRNANFASECADAVEKADSDMASCDPSKPKDVDPIYMKLNNTVADSFCKNYHAGWDYELMTHSLISDTETFDEIHYTLISPLLIDSKFRLAAMIFLYDKLDEDLEAGETVNVAFEFDSLDRDFASSPFQTETVSYDRKNYTRRFLENSDLEEAASNHTVTLIATRLDD